MKVAPDAITQPIGFVNKTPESAKIMMICRAMTVVFAILRMFNSVLDLAGGNIILSGKTIPTDSSSPVIKLNTALIPSNAKAMGGKIDPTNVKVVDGPLKICQKDVRYCPKQ